MHKSMIKPKLCLGTVQLGMDYGVQANGKPNYSEIEGILTDALDQGIETLDTAEAYGEAEYVLGKYIKANPGAGKRFKIISKIAPSAFDEKDKSLWPYIVEQHAQGSLERIGVPMLEGYLLHNAKHIYDEDAVNALQHVKDIGLAKHIGVSVYTPGEAIRALEYDVIQFIQVPYNVLDRRLDVAGFFEMARKKKVTVFARSTLLQGLLTLPLDRLPIHMEFAREVLQKFHDVCNKLSISPLEVAVAYVHAHSGIDHIVFGVDSRVQLKSFVRANDIQLPDTEIQLLNEIAMSATERILIPSLW